MATNALQAIVIKAFRNRLASLGIDPVEVMETASRGRGATASAQSPPTAHEVLETAVAMSGDTALAIKIGNGLDLGKYGTYGFALMSCSDMGAALELFLRYGQTFLQSCSWHRSVSKDEIILRLQQNAGTSYQKMLAPVTRKCSSRNSLSLKRTCKLNCWPPGQLKEHTQFFIPDQWLRQRVRTGDPTTNVLFSQQCEELVNGMTEVDETAAIVRRLLIHSAGKFLSISEVAEQLHVTERTLRRRLAAEGTDFRTIFDDIKNTLAQNYLRKTSLSVVEIADLLNYAEATNFHRAFQRWNSTTPADYRQQALR
jgi:AraC-like DNA-binding protein